MSATSPPPTDDASPEVPAGILGRAQAHPWAAYGLAMGIRVREHEMPVRAAGIAFYGVFSIIPGLVLAFIIYGLVVGPEQASQIIANGFGDALNLDPAELEAQISASLGTAGVSSLLSLLLLLFGTRGLLKSLYRGISVSFGEPLQSVKDYNLRSLLILGIASVAILVAAVWGPITAAILNFLGGIFGPLEPVQRVFSLASQVIAPTLMAAALAGLYGILPRPSPSRRDAIIGAVFATVAFILLRFGYAIYLSFLGGGVVGAFGEFLGLLFFLALTADIVLIGAEVAGRHFPVWATASPSGRN
jgi:membrane protein